MINFRLSPALVVLFLILCLLTSTAKASEQVYEIKAPQNCLDKNITSNTEVSLIDLIKIGICNNPSLSADYMFYQEQEENLKANKSEYFPNISMELGADKTTKTAQKYSTYEQNPYALNLGLSMLLYDFGGRSARIDKFRSYLANSAFEYNIALQDLILSIHKAYFNLLSAKEDLISAKASEAMYKKSYDEAKRKYDIGMAALNDKLQTQTSYEQSKLKVIEMDNYVKQYEGDLATILNLPPQTIFKLKEPPKDRDLTALNKEDTIDKIIELAVKNRLEIKNQAEKINQTNYELKNIRSSRYGSFSLEAGNKYYNSWNNNEQYTRENSIGINYKIPLFTGFNTTHTISSLKKQRQKERFILDDIKNQIKNEVWSAYHDYQTSLKSYDVSKKLLKSAQENEKVAFKSYEIGKTDIINLLTAESQLADARDTLINAFYTVLINKATLYRSIGRF